MRSRFQVVFLMLAAATLLPAPGGAAAPEHCKPWRAGDIECTDFGRMSGEEFRRIRDQVRRFPGLEDLETRADFCKVIGKALVGGECDKARRQYLTLALNIVLGNLGPECCFETPDGNVVGARKVARHVSRLIQSGACARAREEARAANQGRRMTACDRGRDDDGDDDDHGLTCNPRSQGFWKHQCRGTDARAVQPYMDEVRRNPVFVDLRGPKALCRQFEEHGGCDQAELQLAAALLNVASGRLDRDCPIEGRDGKTARDLIKKATRLILTGEHQSCVKANEMLDALNTGRVLDDDGEDDDESGRGRALGHKKAKGEGHEKGKGKGHEKYDD